MRPLRNSVAPRGRSGFTLVELLVVIIIISLLASLTMSALFNAQEQAREQRARTQVKKVQELLMTQWEGYRTRPVQINTAGLTPRQAAEARLWALRTMMRMEMPDRIADVVGDPSWRGAPTPAPGGNQHGPWLGDKGPAAANQGIVLRSASSLWRAYRRRAGIVGDQPPPNWTWEWEDAECLYMIIASMTDGDRKALEFFQPSEIGDVDGDGMPEILDPWGNPIRFLRWAPAFRSPIQQGNVAIHGALGSQTPPFDPFDPLKVDPRLDPQASQYNADYVTFALYPLVYSMGANGRSGLEHAPTDIGAPPPNTPTPSYVTPANLRRNDPYQEVAAGVWLGQIDPQDTAGHADNIHSHLIETR